MIFSLEEEKKKEKKKRKRKEEFIGQPAWVSKLDYGLLSPEVI